MTEVHLDGSRSTVDVPAPATSVRRGRLELEPGWYGTIEADPDASLPPAWRGPHELFRGIGAARVARVEIAANGERYVQARRPSETAHPGVPLCALGAEAAP